MPTLSVYLNDEIYGYLFQRGTPSRIGKAWITERYNRETARALEMERTHMGLDG